MVKKFKEYIKILEDRKENLLTISGLQEVIAKHCIKLYIFPNSYSTLHWMKEIRSFFKTIHKAKDGGKSYEFELYYKKLSYIDGDFIYDDLKIMFDEIKDEYFEGGEEVVRDDYETFVKWYNIFIIKAIKVIQNKQFLEYDLFDLMHEIFEIPE